VDSGFKSAILIITRLRLRRRKRIMQSLEIKEQIEDKKGIEFGARPIFSPFHLTN